MKKRMPVTKKRLIDRRYKPPVQGIDLWQALNYIGLKDVSLEFIYNRYTSSTNSYRKGARPKLEKIVQKHFESTSDEFERISSLARYVAENVKWAGYYEHEHRTKLAPDRALSEEELIESGFGWCNEQARLFCSLAQIGNFPARLVFASNEKGNSGHVVSEILTTKGWMLVDQSLGHCFTFRGKPSSAWDVAHRPAMERYQRKIYRSLCDGLKQVLGVKLLSHSFSMSMLKDPMLGFKRLGYCNYWIG